MSRILHIDGVNDEVLDALMIGGLIYLLFKLAEHAVPGPAGPPGPPGPAGITTIVGPPATIIPPPDGGHTDPIKPPPPAPPAPKPAPAIHPLPAPAGQRDYYHGGPATPAPKPVAHTPAPPKPTADLRQHIVQEIVLGAPRPKGNITPPPRKTGVGGLLQGAKFVAGHVPAAPPPKPKAVTVNKSGTGSGRRNLG